MTILIILGFASLLYLLWSAFRLAVLAVPLFAGLGMTTLLLQRDFTLFTSLATGACTAILFLWMPRLVFLHASSSLAGATVRLVFAGPAAIAGYSLIHGLIGLVLAEGAALTVLSLLGAVLTASCSLRELEPPEPGA